jgi:hypothetical protein
MVTDHRFKNVLITRQDGMAVLVAMIALLLFSIVAMYLSLVATAEVRISDNFESEARARNAALAGIDHVRALLPGLRFDDLLCGPDGGFSVDPAYFASARRHVFRMPVDWTVARLLDIMNPAGAIPAGPDDGVISSGAHPGGSGIPLVPVTGIGPLLPNPNGVGMLIPGRYFVKASDNNGEASELAGDPADNPFVDGDGQILVRSLGIAQTLSESTTTGIRRNSVVVFEARFKQSRTYDLDAPITLQGNAVAPSSAEMFSGSSFLIQGGVAAPGLITLDADPGDGTQPLLQVLGNLAPHQFDCIQGFAPSPAAMDGTASALAHPARQSLFDTAASWKLIRQVAPRFADNAVSGAQNWVGAAPVALGTYNPALPPTSPGQDAKWTFIDGDLSVDGDISGGGLLMVTGKLSIRGNFAFRGLVLVLGAGDFDLGGKALLDGGIYVAGMANLAGTLQWNTSKLSIGGECRVRYDRGLIRMALTLIPPTQLSMREITPIIDP